MPSAKQLAAQRRAEARGFRTVYQMRQFEARNKAIGGAGARTITRDLSQAKDRVSQDRAQQADLLLAEFGVTRAQFNARHRANLEYFEKEMQRRKGSTAMQNAFMKTPMAHTYNASVYKSSRWTKAKVGYVLSFYAANVARGSRYETLFDGVYKEQKDGNLTERALVTDSGKKFLKTNAAQYFYLTQFTDLMTVNEFEVNYGSQQTRRVDGVSLARAVA